MTPAQIDYYFCLRQWHFRSAADCFAAAKSFKSYLGDDHCPAYRMSDYCAGYLGRCNAE